MLLINVLLFVLYFTVQCIEKLTKYSRAFAEGSHVPVHENVVKLMRCVY